jgi:hypothetical protein
MLSNRNLLFIFFALLMSSCSSLQLPDFTEYSKTNHISIQKHFLSYVDSTNSVVIKSVINGKDSVEKILASFNETKPESGGWSLNLTQDAVASYGSYLEANTDTTMVLLSVPTPSLFNGEKRTLHLLDLKKKKILNVVSYTPKVDYISQKIPYTPMGYEYVFFDTQNEVKWINDTTFALATDDGLYKYSINNLSAGKLLYKKTAS